MKFVKNLLRRASSGLRRVVPALFLGLCAGVASAETTLPADVTSAISDFEAQGTALISAVMPTVKALLFAMFGIVALWFCYRQVRKVLGK